MNVVLIAASSTLLALATLGCSLNEKDEKSDRDSSYGYRYQDNGCDTGSHSFPTKLEYCQALLEDDLNNNCAANIRVETFKTACPEYLDEDGRLPTED